MVFSSNTPPRIDIKCVVTFHLTFPNIQIYQNTSYEQPPVLNTQPLSPWTKGWSAMTVSAACTLKSQWPLGLYCLHFWKNWIMNLHVAVTLYVAEFDNLVKKLPKLLSCSHTFCNDCTLQCVSNDFNKTFRCTLCKKRLKVKPDDVRYLPIDLKSNHSVPLIRARACKYLSFT